MSSIPYNLTSLVFLVASGFLCPLGALSGTSSIRKGFALWSALAACVGIWIVYREPLLWIFGLALAGSLLTLGAVLAFRSGFPKRKQILRSAVVLLCLLADTATYRVRAEQAPYIDVTGLSQLTHSSAGEIALPKVFSSDMAIADSTDIFPAVNAERDAVWHQSALFTFVHSHLGELIDQPLQYQNRRYRLLGKGFQAADGTQMEALKLQREK